MKLREIITPEGKEKFFLTLRFDDVSYQITKKITKNNEDNKSLT
jgi:hypothetical protein